MLWLTLIILAYFLFAIVALGDKYLLKGPPNPKIYTFYVGVLGILALFLIPFVGFSIPGVLGILFCLLAGAIYIFALLGFFEGLEKFEASRIIPAIGGFLPIFILALTYSFSGGKEILGPWELLAFLFLLLGSVLITIEPAKKFWGVKSLKVSAITAFLLALTFVLTKYVYLMLPFWTGFIWIRISAFLIVLFFILFREVRKEIFSAKSSFSKKTSAFFLFNQGMGAGAFILQNWAIALAGLAYLSIIGALQGIQYVFLFILAALILKEGLSKKVILQKVIAILLIGLGLAFLVFK